MAAKKTKSTKKPKVAEKHPEIFERIEYQHIITDEERLKLLTELTTLNQAKESLELQRKASAAQWKSQIETVTNKVKSITTNASNGFEMRPIEARVELDRKAGKKTYFFKDTGKVIRTEDMTALDYERLPINVPENKKEEPLKPGQPIVSVSAAINAAEAEPSEEEPSS